MCIRDRPGAVHGTPGVHGACALRGDTAGRGHPRGSAARVGTASGARIALARGAGWYGRSGFLSGPSLQGRVLLTQLTKHGLAARGRKGTRNASTIPHHTPTLPAH